MAGKRLSDLPGRQRLLLGAATVAQGILLAAALFDLFRRPADQIRGPRRLWAALSFVNFVGPISYFAVGRKRK